MLEHNTQLFTYNTNTNALTKKGNTACSKQVPYTAMQSTSGGAALSL